MAKERVLAEVAVDQWGLVTTGQARLLGVTPQVMAKMARAGDLVRLAHGVYRMAGSPINEHEDLRAAWLGLDPTRTASERITQPGVDVVSHRSAARVRGLGDLAADVMEFTVLRRRQTRRADVRLHRGTVTGRDWNLVDGLPAATARRTVDDLAAEPIDRGHLAGIVRDALSRNEAPAEDLARVLGRHARRYGAGTGDGAGLLRVMLEEAGVSAARGVPPAEPFRAADPMIMNRLDPETIRAIVQRLDPETIRAIIPQLGSGSADQGGTSAPTTEPTREPPDVRS